VILWVRPLLGVPLGRIIVTMPDLFDYIRNRTNLPEAELRWFRDKAERRVLERGDVFCTIGQNQHEMAFVESGVLQIYGVSFDGTQNVIDFLFPGGIALALETAVRNMPSRVCIEALRPSTLLVWPYALRRDLLARHVGWLPLQARMTEDAMVRKQAQFLALRMQDARQRYAGLDAAMPGAWRDLPQHLIASYLNITPQYLSALRRAERPERMREVGFRARTCVASSGSGCY